MKSKTVILQSVTVVETDDVVSIYSIPELLVVRDNIINVYLANETEYENDGGKFIISELKFLTSDNDSFYENIFVRCTNIQAHTNIQMIADALDELKATPYEENDESKQIKITS